MKATIELEGKLLDTVNGITTITVEVSDVLQQLATYGFDIEDEDVRPGLDLVDALLLADIQEKFLELNCTERERFHKMVMNYI